MRLFDSVSLQSFNRLLNDRGYRMEPQIPNTEFLAGTQVVYGMHGKCQVTEIQSRQVGSEMVRFYKLELLKSVLSRSSRKDPAIWLPIDSAKSRGLRMPMSNGDGLQAMAFLSSREYFFSLQEPWPSVYLKLEHTIRSEGGIGLAKVASYLYVLKRKQLVPSGELLHFQECVNKLLMRELSEALSENSRVLEDRISKLLRQKLLADN